MTTEIKGSSAVAWEDRERMTALAVIPDRDEAVMRPLVMAEQAKAMEVAYQALCDSVLTDDDFAYYEVRVQQRRGDRIIDVPTIVRRKRKSAWRKLARYFGVDTEVTREVIGHKHNPDTCARIVLAKHGLTTGVDEDCGCPTVYARYHIKVTAPNGRLGFGVGIASTNERGFKAQDHSIPATAYSRAMSRALSDIIGAGDSSTDDPAATGGADAERGETGKPIVDHSAGAPLDELQRRSFEMAWTEAGQDRRRTTTNAIEEAGYGRGEFALHGAADFAHILGLLGGSESPV